MPQTMLPDFENPEWNEQRLSLEAELNVLIERLIDHMSAPAGCAARYEFVLSDGRHVAVKIEAGERPRGN